MKDLVIISTKRTPEIIFKHIGELRISGSSLPEDVAHFYNPVLEWLEKFQSSAPTKISLTIDVDYLNTSSARNVFSILKKLQKLHSSKISVIWIYEQDDDDMLEQGEIFESSINLPFTFIEKVVEQEVLA
jgi:hypothetical protein